MARTKQQNRIISRKVNLLMNEGYELKQAQAIAFRMFREGELMYSKQPRRKAKGYNKKKVSIAAKLVGLAMGRTRKGKKKR
mgnify:CR=1 FL=1